MRGLEVGHHVTYSKCYAIFNSYLEYPKYVKIQGRTEDKMNTPYLQLALMLHNRLAILCKLGWFGFEKQNKKTLELLAGTFL